MTIVSGSMIDNLIRGLVAEHHIEIISMVPDPINWGDLVVFCRFAGQPDARSRRIHVRVDPGSLFMEEDFARQVVEAMYNDG